MKSLNDRYQAAGNNVHETFADLIFCALVVLVLFVMTLAIEVSQRVKTNLAEIPDVPVVSGAVPTAEQMETLSPEEIEELSLEVQQQRSELKSMRDKMAQQVKKMQNQAAALAGEQRFTGATEPAKVLVAYDYKRECFLFVRQKEFKHATTRLSAESIFTYNRRSTRELVELALQTRKQRYFNVTEASRLYAAFSGYKQINPTESSYTISDEELGVTYSPSLSAYIAGDTEISDEDADAVDNAVYRYLNAEKGEAKEMYPSVTVRINPRTQRANINGVELTTKDFKDLLLAVGGRGVMLDFVGYEGKAPDWLKREVLEPAGYIGKLPKLP